MNVVKEKFNRDAIQGPAGWIIRHFLLKLSWIERRQDILNQFHNLFHFLIKKNHENTNKAVTDKVASPRPYVHAVTISWSLAKLLK